MTKTNVYRYGKVYICKTKCATCIYRPGNLMHLAPDRKEGMERDAVAGGGVIPCHKTLGQGEAVCRGFFDTQKHNGLLAVAERMGVMEEVEPPDEYDESISRDDHIDTLYFGQHDLPSLRIVAHNALRRSGLKTVGDLLDLDAREWVASTKNMGVKTQTELFCLQNEVRNRMVRSESA